MSEATEKGFARGRGRPFKPHPETPKIGRLESQSRPSTSFGPASQWVGPAVEKIFSKKTRTGRFDEEPEEDVYNWHLLDSALEGNRFIAYM